MTKGVEFIRRLAGRVRLSRRSSIAVALLSLGLVSCTYAPSRRGGIDMYPGWPLAREAYGGGAKRPGGAHAVRKVAHRPPRGPLQPLKAALPTVPDAEVVGEDELCMICHEPYVHDFAEKNVHRGQKCEDCHGPASEHVATRGQESGKILNPRKLAPAQRSEVCLKCHEQDKVPHVAQWRTSLHAHKEVSCGDCHTAHYEVPRGTPITAGEEGASLPQPSTPGLAAARRKADPQVRPARAAASRVQEEPVDSEAEEKKPSLRGTSQHLGAAAPDVCLRCHEGTYRLNELTGPHQIAPGGRFNCTTCHGVQGELTAQTAKELCLSCHGGPLSQTWHSATHNQADMRCTDCHDPHPNLPPQAIDQLKTGQVQGTPRPMAVADPQTCVRCHEQAGQLIEIADPHQIGGPNKFRCTTCHDPHGQIRQETRQELCLTCHQGEPTNAWHSSVHNLKGVLCTDCHEPHPNSHVQQVVDIRHPNIRRPLRRPMAANDPDTCYKCHPQKYAQSVMPSHHPIWEGKMVCSDCHDSHGQALGLLKEPTINLVCYRCHMEFQGPFVYEHPPVTQDCTICHEPHGTVANNLLAQPTTFLCLRCHSGHRTGPTFHDARLLPDIGTHPELQRAFYTDCTQCHSQIHGSDVPSPNQSGVFAR
jgi:DmsE family decaheme c-type cytochrome